MRKMRAMMKNFTDALFPFSQICFVTIMKQIKFIMLMNGYAFLPALFLKHPNII